jgi:hypothetical protein
MGMSAVATNIGISVIMGYGYLGFVFDTEVQGFWSAVFEGGWLEWLQDVHASLGIAILSMNTIISMHHSYSFIHVYQ